MISSITKRMSHAFPPPLDSEQIAKKHEQVHFKIKKEAQRPIGAATNPKANAGIEAKNLEKNMPVGFSEL